MVAQKPRRPLDPFTVHDAEHLKKRGPGVVRELIHVVEARAEDEDESYADAASRLPEAWRALLLVAWVVASWEDGAPLPQVVVDLPETEDRTLVLRALTEMKEPSLARALSEAEDVADDESSWSDLGPPEEDELARVKRKLFFLVSTMAEPFPAAA